MPEQRASVPRHFAPRWPLYPWTGRPANGYSRLMLLLRRCAALAAAYAVALQLVLSAFAAVAPLALAAEAGFAICRGGDSAPAVPAIPG